MNLSRSCLLVVPLALGGCAQQTAGTSAEPTPAQRVEQLTMERRALQAEVRQSRRELTLLERELDNTRRELENLSSELTPVRSRADVVSSLADARVALDRVSEDADTWERKRIEDGREQLAEAERQVAADRVGSALFFVLRARRTTAEIREYREMMGPGDDTRYVQVDQANVRTEPSMDGAVVTILPRSTPIRTLGRNDSWLRILAPYGRYGWIYGDLVGESP